LCLTAFHYPAYGDAEPSEGQNQIDWDILGSRGGWLHAHLTVNEKYTDNVFYTDRNEDSDFVTEISPGILLATPGTEARIVSTSKDVPGGITISRYERPAFRRFNAYLSYSPGFEIYKDNSDQNITTHQLEGSLQYEFRGGLSLGLFNQFIASYDPYSTRRSDETDQDKYQINLTQFDLGYRLSEKLSVDLGYSYFWVDYDQSESEGYNRVDHTGRGYIYFRVRPRVALFSGYEIAGIDYDERNDRDSIEHRFWGGLQWNVTEKSRGRIKGGYSLKKFDDSDIDDADETIFEAQLIYNFTPKTSLRLTGYRRNEEADTPGSDYTLTYGARAAYLQRITRKITFGMDFWYRNIDYQRDREDDDYRLRPYLSYAFRDWFSMHLRYNFEKRDSNRDDIDFETNSVLLGFTLEI
jgi:hypothetical protein